MRRVLENRVAALEARRWSPAAKPPRLIESYLRTLSDAELERVERLVELLGDQDIDLALLEAFTDRPDPIRRT